MIITTNWYVNDPLTITWVSLGEEDGTVRTVVWQTSDFVSVNAEVNAHQLAMHLWSDDSYWNVKTPSYFAPLNRRSYQQHIMDNVRVRELGRYVDIIFPKYLHPHITCIGIHGAKEYKGIKSYQSWFIDMDSFVRIKKRSVQINVQIDFCSSTIENPWTNETYNHFVYIDPLDDDLDDMFESDEWWIF